MPNQQKEKKAFPVIIVIIVSELDISPGLDLLPTYQTSLPRHQWPLTSPGVIAAVTMAWPLPFTKTPDITDQTSYRILLHLTPVLPPHPTPRQLTRQPSSGCDQTSNRHTTLKMTHSVEHLKLQEISTTPHTLL